nr:hypothetical protein [Aeromonas hydrophila]
MQISKNLNVSVNIVSNQSNNILEIKPSKTSYLARYLVGEQRFEPLEIPFKLKSVSGHAVNYVLSANALVGRCDNEDLTLSSTLDGVKVDLNSYYSYFSVEREHRLVVDFPIFTQSQNNVYCEGYVSVVASLDI